MSNDTNTPTPATGDLSGRLGATSVTGTTLLTITEAMARLSVSRSGLYALVRSGALPIVKLGRATRIDPADLLRLVNAARKTGLGPEISRS